MAEAIALTSWVASVIAPMQSAGFLRGALDIGDLIGDAAVARVVCSASDFTSCATTAKPRPASPARAASIVALSASMLVCWAIPVIIFHDAADMGDRRGQLVHAAHGSLSASCSALNETVLRPGRLPADFIDGMRQLLGRGREARAEDGRRRFRGAGAPISARSPVWPASCVSDRASVSRWMGAAAGTAE